MTYKTVNPYTNETLKTYPNAPDSELGHTLNVANDLYHQWRKEPVSSRKSTLHAIADKFREDREELASTMTKEMGKLIGEAEAEVDLCADIADYFADKAEEFMRPKPLKTDTGDAYIKKQATGVLMMVEPWNFPYYQIMRVFAPNFMVGNPMILKHSSNTPTCAQLFMDEVLNAGAPQGSLTNLFIDYSQVSKAIADPRVTGVALTGSNRGGASVAKEAGANLKKSTMELGGNDAFIILEDADWDLVKEVAPGARLANAGQICSASKRFIVMADQYDRFLEMMKDAFSKMILGDPLDRTTTLAPLSSAKAKEGLQAKVDEAISYGAKVYYGNTPVDLAGQFFTPTILTDVTKENPIFDEELFGPVATVYKVNSEQEAIDLANSSSFGLGSVIFSKDTKHAQAVAEKIEAGMSFINMSWTTRPELPFGGVKDSGYGRELYELGFDAFVNEHLVIAKK